MNERTGSGKSADAYRTIGEVAEELKLPQHVLRFWETRFPQVKPLKRAGGRRFYRPDDVALLRAIKAMLYGQGYTIKGVQRLLKDQGARGLREGDAVPPAFDERGEADALGEAGDDGPFIEVPPVAPLDGAETIDLAEPSHRAEPPLDRQALAETLSLVEECTCILLALRRAPG